MDFKRGVDLRFYNMSTHLAILVDLVDVWYHTLQWI